MELFIGGEAEVEEVFSFSPSQAQVALGGSCVEEAKRAREMSWGTRSEGRLVEVIVGEAMVVVVVIAAVVVVVVTLCMAVLYIVVVVVRTGLVYISLYIRKSPTRPTKADENVDVNTYRGDNPAANSNSRGDEYDMNMNSERKTLAKHPI